MKVLWYRASDIVSVPLAEEKASPERRHEKTHRKQSSKTTIRQTFDLLCDYVKIEIDIEDVYLAIFD